MRRRGTAAWTGSVVAALAASFVASAASAAGSGTVSLQAVSATVQNPGDTGQICVVLNTGGNQVVGTQNELVWDGTCATLTAAANCSAVGSHGKQVAADSEHQTNDFSVRVLVLSLTDTSLIPNGPLYCCAFEGEAEPGQCCNVTVIDTSASGPHGEPLTALGNTAHLCTAASSDQSGGGVGGGVGQPSSVNNAPAGNGTGSGATTAPPPPAGSGAAAPPPAQVLPGGGAPVENPAAAGVPAVPPLGTSIQAMTPAAAQEPVQPVAGVPVAAPVPAAATVPTAAGVPAAAGVQPAALPPATVAATSAPTPAATKPPAVDTPTNAPTAAPTAPTKAPPTSAQAAAVAPDPPKSGGLFGCQIAGAPSGAPLLGLVWLALIGRTARRRRRTRR